MALDRDTKMPIKYNKDPKRQHRQEVGGMLYQVYEGELPYIFISYSHADSRYVLPVIHGLQEQGFRVWYDFGIQAGKEWPEFIARRLLDSYLIISFVSKNSVMSHNCRREINFALDEGKKVLAVHLESVDLSPGMRMQLHQTSAIHVGADRKRILAALGEKTAIIEYSISKIPAVAKAKAIGNLSRRR